ncbi:MAG: hypothetical protein IJ809_02615 [Clostridia bacterium]|nr:hypothetical protein [Clostridia bacterium]
MYKSKKILTSVFIVIFFFTIILSLVASTDILHLESCHKDCCTRCNIINNSLALVNSIKNTVVIISYSLFTYVIVGIIAKKYFSFEYKTPVKMKVTLIE